MKRDPANNPEDRIWISDRRCLWNGHIWAVTEWVHISDVEFYWPIGEPA